MVLVLHFCYLLLAIGVGYSRIYLGQHFLEDVTGGGIIGVFFGGCIFIWVKQVRLFHWNINKESMSSPMMMQ